MRKFISIVLQARQIVVEFFGGVIRVTLLGRYAAVQLITGIIRAAVSAGWIELVVVIGQPGGGPSGDARLLEDGSYRLLEDGSFRLLE